MDRRTAMLAASAMNSSLGLLRISLVGASGHGLVVADIVRRAGRQQIIGFLDSGKPVGAGPAGLPILGPGEAVAELAREYDFSACIVAVGHNEVRRRCVAMLRTKLPELRFDTAIHPSAVVAECVEIGDGSVVMAGAVINPGCRIGRHCIVNTGACLDHESVMGDFSSVAPGVVTGGNVQIGTGAAVCLGAKIIHGVHIGAESVVGAGTLVLENVPDACLVYGSPARVVRSRKPQDRYM